MSSDDNRLSILVCANYCFLPGSVFANCINTASDMFCIDNLNSHIYWIAGKVGATNEGASRLAYYIAQYADRGLPCPPIFSLIDISNLSEAIQMEVTAAILKSIAGLVPRALPRTIEDVFRLDRDGLNVFTQLFFTLSFFARGYLSLVSFFFLNLLVPCCDFASMLLLDDLQRNSLLSYAHLVAKHARACARAHTRYTRVQTVSILSAQQLEARKSPLRLVCFRASVSDLGFLPWQRASWSLRQ